MISNPFIYSIIMTTKYFVLSKRSDKKVDDNEHNQICNLNSPMTFILPSVLIDYYTTHGLFESSLIEWTKQLCSPTKTFIDIGAHSGTYSICLADYSQQVYSFEPQRMTYYALCGSVALSNKKNIICHNLALGSPEQVGPAVLNIHSQDGGGSSLHKSESSQVITEETISVVTMDSLNINNIGFIKMDVEDNELYVLKGAQNTLSRNGYPKILFESNTSNPELFGYLQNELGYRIITLRGSSNMFLAER